MAFFVSWVRIFFGASFPNLELLAPPPKLAEDFLPALSPVSGKPPVVVGSFVVSTGFLPAKKAKNPAASIMMIIAVMIIFVVLFITKNLYNLHRQHIRHRYLYHQNQTEDLLHL